MKIKIRDPFKIILCLILAYFLIFTAKYQIQRIRLEKERKELIAKIEEQTEIQNGYLEELERVGTDEYYEYLARKYLGYIKPNEKVIVWVEDKK